MTPTDPDLVTRLRHQCLNVTFAANEPCGRCVICRAVHALEARDEPARDGSVLQAVLDAIAGTLDPHTQIADHPNVKFAQMRRLDLLEALDAARQREGDLERCSEHPEAPLELVCVECFESDLTAAANERAETAEARVQQLEAALTTLRDQWAQSLLTMRGEFVATQMAAVEDCIDGLAQILGRADTPEPPHED